MRDSKQATAANNWSVYCLIY